MAKFYCRISEMRGGFFDTTIHGEIGSPGCTIPVGAKEIPDELYAELTAPRTDGKLVYPDADGNPVLVDLPTASLEELQFIAWGQIKADRDRRKDLGVLAAGHWFHSDSVSRIQQLALVIMGQNMPAGIQWKTMSDEFVLMTPTLAGQIFTATATLDQVLFSNAITHRTAMMAAAVPSEYDFSTGWPAFYQE